MMSVGHRGLRDEALLPVTVKVCPLGAGGGGGLASGVLVVEVGGKGEAR